MSDRKSPVTTGLASAPALRLYVPDTVTCLLWPQSFYFPSRKMETALAICQRGLKTYDTGGDTVGLVEKSWTTGPEIYLASRMPVTSFWLMLVSQVTQGLKMKSPKGKKMHITK